MVKFFSRHEIANSSYISDQANIRSTKTILSATLTGTIQILNGNSFPTLRPIMDFANWPTRYLQGDSGHHEHSQTLSPQCRSAQYVLSHYLIVTNYNYYVPIPV